MRPYSQVIAIRRELEIFYPLLRDFLAVLDAPVLRVIDAERAITHSDGYVLSVGTDVDGTTLSGMCVLLRCGILRNRVALGILQK